MTMTEEELRDRICRDKRQYRTGGGAAGVAATIRAQDGSNVTHYRCPLCRAFHVGHPPAMATLEALARIIRGLPIEEATG